MTTKKRTTLPAIGKTKPKKPKSSIRELGEKAAKEYGRGNKPPIPGKKVNLRKSEGYLNDKDDVTDREWAKEVALAWKRERGSPNKGSGKGTRVPATENWYSQQARNTGMAKGGVVRKRVGKK